MSSEDAETPTTSRRMAAENGPFVLRSLLEDIPLSADDDREDIRINCVEFLDSNLYVGTSASEILHFVQIPPDPDDSTVQPSYILASRLPPQGESTYSPDKPGVQQILLLPKVQKGLVLCNGIVTFYSLPELSPIFENIPTLDNCGWAGGVDLNSDSRTQDEDPAASITVLLSLKRKLRPVNIGQKAKGLKLIDFAGSIISVRRDSIACVADTRSYALLDVDQQLKIPLFPISSLDDSQGANVGGRAEDISGGSGSAQRSVPSTQKHAADAQTHSRGSSLGTLISASRSRTLSDTRDRSNPGTPEHSSRVGSPAPAASPLRSLQREASPSKLGTSPDKPLPPPPFNIPSIVEHSDSAAQLTSPVYLKPHIVSPSSQEFLLVTGTAPHDPGVGMFVNLDGDVTRSTLEFDRYPEALVTDGRGQGFDVNQNNMEDEEEGFVLASMGRIIEDELVYGLEIQRWDLDPGERALQKVWLSMPMTEPPSEDQDAQAPGLRCVIDRGEINFPDAVDRLRLRRFRTSFQVPRNSQSSISQEETGTTGAESDDIRHGLQRIKQEGMPEGAEELRDEEEHQFAKRLGRTQTRVIVWTGKRIWWAVRNPLALQLDANLATASSNATESETESNLDRQKVVETINSIRGREAKTEIEFVGLGYIRQRAGLLLLVSLLSLDLPPLDAEDRIAEEALLNSGLDPRVVIYLLPRLRQEVIEGKSGIWIHGGVLSSAEEFLSESFLPAKEPIYILQLYRRYLIAWRTKKGFGSIASETEVFRSVDAALLIVLLELDAATNGTEPAHPPPRGSIRSELYSLVDNGIDCFDRAIDILEHYDRLYVLSRLYQSKKMSAEVLSTWKRIMDSPPATRTNEFLDGEQVLRSYLSKISNTGLVQEYGVWLAARNTKLGIQVFADDRSRVKFEPTQVVEILRKGAPSAIKEYLEYLVFGKGHNQYVNELISYYLDIVISTLESSEEAKALLAQTYSSYRALTPPKPTYRQFITDNAIHDEWWHSRLRLLQLLGGSHGSASEYDVQMILDRIEPYTKHLVPELIILRGRQEMHAEALGLLVHNLGDYDTAINYCLLGGSSIYHPVHTQAMPNQPKPSKTEQAHLFRSLLSLFLRLEDLSDCVEQTSSLLGKYGTYFDVADVLHEIPDSWSVDLISGFLVGALRQVVAERRRSGVVKAISGAENLAVSVEAADFCKGKGAAVERT